MTKIITILLSKPTNLIAGVSLGRTQGEIQRFGMTAENTADKEDRVRETGLSKRPHRECDHEYGNASTHMRM